MKRSTNNLNLTTNEAMMLQQIHEDGEDDLGMLSAQLSMPKARVAALIQDLKRKGLLIIDHDFQGTWIRLSAKGNCMMSYIWPEARMA